MKREISFKGKKIILRKLRRSDASSLAQHGNDKLISQNLRSTFPFPYRVKDAKEFINRTHSDWRKGKAEQFGIELKETRKIIGMIGFVKMRKHAKEGRIGYWVGRKYWRRGIGAEALQLILSYGFNGLGLNKISACVFGPNKPSQKLLKKFGFKKEGVLREYIIRGGRYLDQVEYGILRKEYKR